MIHRQLQLFWLLLCRSSSAIVNIANTLLSLVYNLLNVFLKLSSPRKWLADQPQKSMENRARFRLLHLDYVAIREVLNVLDPTDYINFSKVSKACRKLSAIKKPYKVCLTILTSSSIMIVNGSITYQIRWTNVKNNYGTRMEWLWWDESRKYLDRCSENPLDDMKEFYQYARSLVGVDIDRAVFDMDHFNGKCREIVDWLGLNFSEMQALCVSGRDQRQEELQYVLDNVKVKDSLNICAETIEQLPLKIPETIQKLCITNGSWITLDYVMSLKMSQLALRDTHLTNQDLNEFLKSWMQMKSHRNLESFETDLTNHEDFPVVGLRGITYKMGPRRPEL
ncbi:hypothetical protein B9Z55_015116 [Caenorhabditis nigoni]|nr:hypothetical protein B9Z55_015116 [Caenorhabditis nigoni]